MFICGDGESSVIKGIQARVLVGEEVLADCYWTEKEGINLCPITFSTYTDDENDQIIGSVFIQGGLMKSPVITDSFKDIKPDAEYKSWSMSGTMILAIFGRISIDPMV